MSEFVGPHRPIWVTINGKQTLVEYGEAPDVVALNEGTDNRRSFAYHEVKPTQQGALLQNGPERKRRIG